MNGFLLLFCFMFALGVTAGLLKRPSVRREVLRMLFRGR